MSKINNYFVVVLMYNNGFIYFMQINYIIHNMKKYLCDHNLYLLFKPIKSIAFV